MNGIFGTSIFHRLSSPFIQRGSGGLLLSREASKKASGGKRNGKQAAGKNRGIMIGNGGRAFPNDLLVHRQSRLWYHPGLNVRLGGKNNLIALKEGTVRVTCEIPDLDFKNPIVQRFYAPREGQTFYKKYFHIIPEPQKTRFKCIDQI